MKRTILAGLLVLLALSEANAQCAGILAAGSVCGNPSGTGSLAIPTRTPVLGLAGTAIGTLGFSGNTSGIVTVRPQAAAGTYNFNLPTGAGTSGQPLLSGGGGAAAMSFGTLGLTGGGTGAITASAARTALGTRKWFNVVTDCGATGNGSTNDATAINSCVTSAIAAGGGNVYFPTTSSCYFVSSSITATSTVPVGFIGDGIGQSAICPSGAAITVFSLDYTGGDSALFYMADLTIRSPVGGAGIGTGATAINCVHCNGGLMERVQIGTVIGKFDNGINTSQSATLKIRNSKFYGTNGYAIRAVVDTTAHGMVIDTNIFLENGVGGNGGAIVLGTDDATAVVSAVKITNNDFGNNYNTITINETASVLISGNYMETPYNSHFIVLCGVHQNKGISFTANHINGQTPTTPGPSVASTSTLNCVESFTAKSNDLANWTVTCAATCGPNAEFVLEAQAMIVAATVTGFNKLTPTTPAVSAIGGPGTFAATASLRTWHGVLIHVKYVVTITNVGTATGWSVPLPSTPQGSVRLSCFTHTNGIMGSLWNGGGTGTTVTFYKYDGTTAPTAEPITCNGEYERG